MTATRMRPERSMVAIGGPTRNAIARRDFVPNDGLRAAAIDAIRTGQVTGWVELGKLVGLAEDSIRRSLGVSPWSRKRERRFSRYVRYETAVNVVRELGLDPVDFGI